MTWAPDRAACAERSAILARLNALSPLRFSNCAVAILRSSGTLALPLFPRRRPARLHQQPGEEIKPRRDARDIDPFVIGVECRADEAQPVECGRADRHGHRRLRGAAIA